jgi:hypothetical protein
LIRTGACERTVEGAISLTNRHKAVDFARGRRAVCGAFERKRCNRAAEPSGYSAAHWYRLSALTSPADARTVACSRTTSLRLGDNRALTYVLT